MPFSHLGWRVVVPAVILFALFDIGAIKFIRDAYPADPFKAEALAKCVAGDPGFVRFFSDQRDQCYARQPRTSRLETASDAQRD